MKYEPEQLNADTKRESESLGKSIWILTEYLIMTCSSFRLTFPIFHVKKVAVGHRKKVKKSLGERRTVKRCRDIAHSGIATWSLFQLTVRMLRLSL